MTPKLGEFLLKERLVTEEQLAIALKRQMAYGGRLGSILINLGFVSDDDITSLLSRQHGVPSINLFYFEVDSDVIKLVPMETAQKYQILPVIKVGSTLTVATTDPTNVFAIDDVKFMTGLDVQPVIASETAIQEAIEKYYGTPQAIELEKVYEEIALQDSDVFQLDMTEEVQDLSDDELQRSSEEAPIIKLVNMIIGESLRRGASDIHVEPYEREFRVRYRIDGILYRMMSPPLKLKDAIISRIKIMSKMDISEKRLPQDGRVKIRTVQGGKRKEVDFRVSSLPTLFGEKIVIRVLDKSSLPIDMTKLGFEPDALRKFENAIHKPYGMVLVTGPTGSGKTSSLYASITQLNQPETNIMTVEDPVEFNFPGINQVQVREQIGLTFAAVLRAFLRQDPDIILVGEIRDFETAEIAIKAALTGHLVLSTLHTNDAPSSISRLLNMGIEPFLVATSVHMVAAQRLVRTICPDCKTRDKAPIQSLLDLGMTQEDATAAVVYRGEGCKACNNSGYFGRIGLFEVMEVTEEVQQLILVGGSARELRRQATEEGMISLRQSGILKVKDGVTTIDEVLRETVIV